MGEMPSPSPPSMAFVRPSVENRPPSLARSQERGRFPMTHSAPARQEEEHDDEASDLELPQTRTISSFRRPTRPGVIFLHRGSRRGTTYLCTVIPKRGLHCPSKVSSDTTPHSDEMRPNQQHAHGSTHRLVMLPSGKIEERL